MRGVTRVADLLEVASGEPRIANEEVPRLTWTAEAPEQGKRRNRARPEATRKKRECRATKMSSCAPKLKFSGERSESAAMPSQSPVVGWEGQE